MNDLKPSCMTPKQYEAIKAAMQYLHTVFPDLTPQQMVAGPLAEAAYGRLPDYSNLTAHNVTKVATADAGAFAVPYGFDPASGKIMTLVIQRGEIEKDGRHTLGAPGGHINLDFTPAGIFYPASEIGEQPAQGCVREFGEEVLDADGKPIITPDPARYIPVDHGIDYTKVPEGRLPVHYDSYALPWTPEELARLRAHTERMHTDAAYRAAVFEKSKNEVSNVFLVPLEKIATIKPSWFKYAHELTAYKKVNELVQEELKAALALRSGKRSIRLPAPGYAGAAPL